MKFEISSSLKELINRTFSINYDDFELYFINCVDHGIYNFIFKNNTEKYISIQFTLKSIELISLLNPVSIKITNFNYMNFENIDTICRFTILGKTYLVANSKFLKPENYDFTVNEAFATFLKLCDFNQFREEINSKKIHY